MKGISRIATTVATLAIVLLPLSSQAAGIGLSPAELEVKNLRPGTEVAAHISFSRGNPSESQKADIVIKGPAADYIFGEKEVTLPQGENITVYPFVIKPGNLAAGVYQASILIAPRISSEEVTTSGSRVIAAAQGVIRFTVTNNIVSSYIIKELTLRETEEGTPLGFSYLLINDGNVDARPDSIAVTITDNNDFTNVYKETIPAEELQPVKAFSQQEVSVLTKAQLVTGLYTAKFAFYNEDNEVIFETQRALQVFPQGTLAQQGTLEKLAANKGVYQKGELVKFTGNFINTGDVGLSAALAVEIIQNNKVIDTVKAEPIFVGSKKDTSLETTYRPQVAGAYKARGYVVYGPRHSNDINLGFLVKPANTILIVIFLVLVTIGIGIFVWLRHRKRIL